MRISELFHAAVAKPAAQRAAFLDEACDGDEGLRRELESLLASDDSAQNFLNTPAAGAAVTVMAGVRMCR